MAGIKNDGKKPRLNLIPPEFSIGVGKALTFGANKYEDFNFCSGINYNRLLAAAKRHMELEIAGVKVDRESGLEHWMCAAASLAMYAFMKAHRPDCDDRYVYTPEQLKEIEKMMYGEIENEKVSS